MMILSEAEYKQFYTNIMMDLPEIGWDKTMVGRGNPKKPTHFDLRITPVNPQEVHIRATFYPIDKPGYAMTTVKPIPSEYETIASQLLEFEITDISDLQWHTEEI